MTEPAGWRQPGAVPVHRPLAGGLPAVYLSDPFTLGFVSSFDDVLVPVFAVLDSLHAYVDPDLCPDDFVPWLGGWLGVSVEERWPEYRRRSFVRDAVEVYRWRGTARGIRDAVHAYAGIEPEIEESGGTSSSRKPRGPLPGSATASLTVRLRGPADVIGSLSESSIDRLVRQTKPAHVPHVIVMESV